jgi:hypothetical protein
VTSLHAFLNGGPVTYDVWSVPPHLPCDECGVPFRDHGSFGAFSAPGLDEVVCYDTYCPMHSTEANHTLADHVEDQDP